MKHERKKNTLIFVGLLLVGGIIGGASGMLLNFQHDLAKSGIELVRDWSLAAAPVGLVVLGVWNLVLTIWYDRKGKRLYAGWDQEEEQTFEEMERCTSMAMSYTAVGITLSMILFGIYTVGMTEGCYDMLGMWGNLAICGLFIALVVFMVLYQRKLVDFDRKLNPEKQADVLDLHFQKKWLASCDEQEKKIVGEACYRSFMVTSQVYLGLLLIILLCGMFFETGILPYFVLGAAWLTQQIVYLKETMKRSGYRKA